MPTRCLWAFLLAAAIGWGAPHAAVAQQPETDIVEEVRAAFQRLEYDVAGERARRALGDSDLQLGQRVELHTLLALIAFTQQDLNEARLHFELALDLDPTLALDPVLVSPKALEFLEDVRRTRAEQRRPGTEGQAVRYVVVRDERPDAALRSMLVPGWGQLYKGERVKGWALAGLWGAAAGGSLYAQVRYTRAHDAYLDERDPAQVSARYDRADTWYKARNNLILAAAGVWLVSYVDALVSRPKPPPGAQAHVRITPSVAPRQFGLQAHLRF